MPGPVSTTPFGIQGPLGLMALAVFGPNTRVKGAQGLMGTAVDQVLFPFSIFGQWIVPNTRVQIGGVPTVGASSQGMTYIVVNGVPAPIGPMFVFQPDTRISNT